MESYSHHAHVYFALGAAMEDQRKLADQLCHAAAARFGIKRGRMYDRPVGPHPMGSCQLLIPTNKSRQIIDWLDNNRGGLTILVHELTGDDLTDHTVGVRWLGAPQTLDLSIFTN